MLNSICSESMSTARISLYSIVDHSEREALRLSYRLKNLKEKDARHTNHLASGYLHESLTHTLCIATDEGPGLLGRNILHSLHVHSCASMLNNICSEIGTTSIGISWQSRIIITVLQYNIIHSRVL